jgi:hypothetical protein
MGIQTYVNNRSKVQFSNYLPFGKIVNQGTATITAGALSVTNTSVNHTYTSTPLIFGWCRFTGDNRWIPMVSTNVFVFPELGFQADVYPFATATTYGVRFRNRDSGGSHTVNVKYWVFVV